jgi:phosphoribosylamine--glycine ligase
VLNVVACDADIDSAVKKAYEAVGQVSFEGMTCRKDIGWRALKRPG